MCRAQSCLDGVWDLAAYEACMATALRARNEVAELWEKYSDS